VTGAGRQREIERWVARVRVVAIPFAIFQVAVANTYPPGYERAAWIVTALFALGTALIFLASRRDEPPGGWGRLSVAALTFDTAVISSFTLVYSYEPGTPIRQLLYLPLVEAALRYGIRGALVLTGATTPILIFFEHLRADRFAPHTFQIDYLTFQLGVEAIMALIVGWLVKRLRSQTTFAEARVGEAEELRDELGRRVDLLEAANRCARALSSSLQLEPAFAAFIRELRGLVAFDRTAIVLVEEGSARVIATAGSGADDVFPPGSDRPLEGSVLERVLMGETVYREDMSEPAHPEETDLVGLGLRSRVAAPLQQGPRTIGMLSVLRSEPDAFRAEEIELLTLLGRLVATAVQNIRAYEAERSTVDELRRLSALRADFVSLVSHELRSPMAAVIGSARTLQARWRELAPEQRESFLALIADETTRLAALIGDVLDTSRIEAGTFSYTFTDVDIAELVRDTVATAQVGQDEVRLQASVTGTLRRVRGDRERLRQVLQNMIENAVKYSPVGAEVGVSARPENGLVRVDVRDEGPGIPLEHQKLIFEKFGRAANTAGTPGTGLGLFIARSIAEAHGGELTVRSTPDHGATFTLVLPVSS
jgi:signal transduction histidine kinase